MYAVLWARTAGCRMTPLCAWLSARARAARCVHAPRACTASCTSALFDFVALSVHAGVHVGTRVSVSVWLRVFQGEGGRGVFVLWTYAQNTNFVSFQARSGAAVSLWLIPL